MTYSLTLNVRLSAVIRLSEPDGINRTKLRGVLLELVRSCPLRDTGRAIEGILSFLKGD